MLNLLFQYVGYLLLTLENRLFGQVATPHEVEYFAEGVLVVDVYYGGRKRVDFITQLTKTFIRWSCSEVTYKYCALNSQIIWIKITLDQS